MIIILHRSDLSRMSTDLEADFIDLQHFRMSIETTQRAELIVFLEDSHVYVVKGSKWPYGKPMSAAELIKYIAHHVA